MNARSPFVPAGAVANTVHRRGELCWGAGGFGEAARRLASVTAGHSVAPQITHSAGRRVSVHVTDERADRGQLREAHTGMDHRGGVTLLDRAAAVEAHRAQRREAVR